MLSLLNKAKFLLGGNIFFAFSQWLILVCISHFSNSKTVGEYAYALAVVVPIFMLTNLQLRPLVVANYNLKNNFSYENYFSLRFYSIFFAIILCIIFSFFTSSNIFLTILLVGIIKALEALSDIIYAYYNAQSKTKLISFSLLLKSLFLIIVFSSILYFTKSLALSLISIILVYFTVLVLVDLKNIGFNKSFFSLDFKEAKEIIILALPLGVSVMLVALQSNIPRFFLEKNYNLELVGVFSVFYYFVIVGGIVVNSVCQFLSPKFSIYYKENERKKLLNIAGQAWIIAFFLGISGLLISVFFGDFFVKVIYGEDYLPYINVLNIVMVAGLFTYLSVVNGYLMTSVRLIKIQLPLFILLTLLTFILSWVLILPKGLVGAAWVCVLSAALQFILSTIILYVKMVRRIDA